MSVMPIHILLIEDDEEFRELLMGFLQDEGYQVTDVANGEHAIEAAQKGVVDLVIADVKLGGMDGLDALSRIKDHQSELQGLVMTGYSTEADSIRAVKLGVGNYLKKPFTMTDFLRAVESLVQRVLQEREARDRERALLETLAWALGSVLLGCPDLEKPIETAQRARDAALFCGLGGLVAEDVRLALLAVLARRHGEPAGIPFVFKGLPRSVAALLQSFEDGASLEEQLVRYGVASVEGHVIEVDAQVRQGFQEGSSQQRGAQGLLPLGLALESAGDLEGASRVFSRMIDDSSRGRDTVQGHLGRARVLFAQGQATQSLSELEMASAVEKDSALAAVAALERGVLLARMGQRAPAVEGLRVARSGFQRTGQTLGLARAELALLALGDDDGEGAGLQTNLALLLQPQNLDGLFASAAWLVPFLLQKRRGSNTSPEVLRGLRRFFRDLPVFVAQWIRHARSEEIVLTALSVISEVGLAGYEPTLSALAQDSREGVRHEAQRLLSRQAHSESTPPTLRLLGFGEFEAFVGDSRVPSANWKGKKSIYLLSYLALRPGEFVPREVLVEQFWPDAGERGFKSLSQLLVVIRRALQPANTHQDIHYIGRQGTSLGMNPDLLIWHDAVEVEACLKRASDLPGNDGAQELERAFELYRGPYLEGCYMDWALETRRDLERRLVEAWLRLAEVRLTQQRYSEALEVAEAVLLLDPYCQLATQRGMEAQVRLGRPEEALRAFERCSRLLAADLEIEPSIDLLRTYHQAKLAP